MSTHDSKPSLKIGWAEADITPQQLPVYIAGQFHARISEGIADPISATALVLDSGDEHVVFVSIDAVGVSNELRDAIRAQLHEDGLDAQKVILHVTHTHEAPLNRVTAGGAYRMWGDEKEELELDVVPANEYVRFAAMRIAEAVSTAWRNRAPGGVAYGHEDAVIGRNRRWMNRNGVATMYGLNKNSAERFHHIEGYEDHSVNLLATYDASGVLTGIVVNLPCPSQETEHMFEISADFWHETRQELRARFGENLFILPQVSAAGDLTSHLIFENEPHDRMLKLRGRSARQEIAVRIADAVGRVLPYLPPTIESTLLLEHHVETLQLPLNRLTQADVEDAQKNIAYWTATYEEEKQKLADNPELRDKPRWYVPATQAVNRVSWYRGVIERFEQQQTNPHFPTEVHILRLGDIAFATNQFEYYLDFGIEIKVKSPAIQTFIVQLAGNGTYVPSPRAAAGGGYGAVAASNPVGPEGGQLLADFTVNKIREQFQTASQ